jgi:Ca2+-binding EF-hand superfamily protein
MSNYFACTTKVRHKAKADEKGYIDADDLRRASEITGVELTEEEMEEMVKTERNRGSGLVDFEDFKYFMEEELQYL